MNNARFNGNEDVFFGGTACLMDSAWDRKLELCLPRLAEHGAGSFGGSSRGVLVACAAGSRPTRILV